MTDTVGWYITPDDALCADHAPEGFAAGEFSAWIPVHGWESPAEITSDSESDTPTHCTQCEALIPHALTSDGMDYVKDHLLTFINDEGGRAKIMHAWLDEYGEQFYADDLLDIIREAIQHRATADD